MPNKCCYCKFAVTDQKYTKNGFLWPHKNFFDEQTIYSSMAPRIAGLDKRNLDLQQIIVMPIPMNLTIMNVSHNELEFLPEWITDLSKIVTISAHHNRLKKLPYRWRSLNKKTGIFELTF
jgi:Leucine-rich repeat (LRR) protein